jgi:alpha-galactosidase
MKRIIFIASLLLGVSAAAQNVLSTDNTSLVIDAAQGKAPKILYYGAKLSELDLSSLSSSGFTAKDAYPTHNSNSNNLEALSVRMPDGNLSVDLNVVSVDTKTWDGGKIFSVLCKDPLYPLEVRLVYKSYDAEDVISTWTEIINGNKKKSIVLTRFDS